MDIGTKIKQARMEAGLKQEQVAEALGVSRQTVSNWENEKTYPDIISVVRMSDLYAISLDHLLKDRKDPKWDSVRNAPSDPAKEEMPMSNYLEYLEESTNIVKSNTKRSKLILVLTYLGIWAFSLIVFWCFMDGGDAMAYSLMFLWVLLPVTTFVTSLLIGRNDYWGPWKWHTPWAFGILYMLAEYGTFSLANMVSFGKINLPSVGMIVAGAVISVVGLAMGTAIRRWRRVGKA